MKRILWVFLFLSAMSAKAQFTDRYWAFGDSAGIDFKNLSNPQPANRVLEQGELCIALDLDAHSS